MTVDTDSAIGSLFRLSSPFLTTQHIDAGVHSGSSTLHSTAAIPAGVAVPVLTPLMIKGKEKTKWIKVQKSKKPN